MDLEWLKHEELLSAFARLAGRENNMSKEGLVQEINNMLRGLGVNEGNQGSVPGLVDRIVRKSRKFKRSKSLNSKGAVKKAWEN